MVNRNRTRKYATWRYVAIENDKKQEFTGVWTNKADAAKWFLRWGAYWSAKGYNLKLIKKYRYENVFISCINPAWLPVPDCGIVVNFR